LLFFEEGGVHSSYLVPKCDSHCDSVEAPDLSGAQLAQQKHDDRDECLWHSRSSPVLALGNDSIRERHQQPLSAAARSLSLCCPTLRTAARCEVLAWLNALEEQAPAHEPALPAPGFARRV
jgi:hypothetical protein